MKKYRCPNCGEECLSWSDKCHFGGRKSDPVQANRCQECHGYFVAKQRDTIGSALYTVFITVPFVPLLFLSLANRFFILILLIYAIVFIIAITLVRNALFGAIIKYDEYMYVPVMPIPDGFVTLTQVKGKIRELDILGIRFSQSTMNVRFSEAFTNQLVPVVFHNKNKATANQPIRVTIMKREFVPRELLYEGSQFVVIDNGKEVATGFISEIITP